MQDQSKLERTSTTIRPDVGKILSTWSSYAGFRARRNLYHVSKLILTIRLLLLSRIFCGLLQVFQLTAPVYRGSSRRGAEFSIKLERVAVSRGAVEGVIVYKQDFV